METNRVWYLWGLKCINWVSQSVELMFCGNVINKKTKCSIRRRPGIVSNASFPCVHYLQLIIEQKAFVVAWLNISLFYWVWCKVLVKHPILELRDKTDELLKFVLFGSSVNISPHSTYIIALQSKVQSKNFELGL